MNGSSNTVLDPDTVSTILKWAVTILVAGFIAQFGKKFANFLVDKIRSLRKKKREADGTQEVPAQVKTGDDSAIEGSRLKLEKKKAKNEAKKEKKMR